MKNKFREIFLRLPAEGIRRFPLGLIASVVAAMAAILLQHQKGIGFDSEREGSLTRLLLLWPFALFGNVAWALRCEHEHRQKWLGLAILFIILIGGWFLLPVLPKEALSGFWFAYWFSIACLLCATLSLAARRQGPPSLWDAGWAIVLAAFMAMLSALIVVGGINAALISIEKLFSLKIGYRIYTDVALTGFFLLGPLTAFAWLPHPFGVAQPQHTWLKGFARVILTPLCVLYAIILFIYIGKIALAAKWPDGWVAMPTLVFAAVGLVGYLIARPARDMTNERWAGWFCRLFPAVLLPLSVVLLLAMRIRVIEYGFTEWRAAGVFLGSWLLAFALGYTVWSKISPWWITTTLTILLAVATAGPFSLNAIAIRSQCARLDKMLDQTGVWQRKDDTIISVSAKNGKDIRSAIQYLLRNHGADALPERVATRWTEWRTKKGETPLSSPSKRSKLMYNEENNVLAALGISILNDTPQWMTIRCDSSFIAITNWARVSVGRMHQPGTAMIMINNDLQISVSNCPVATNEVSAFCQHLDQTLMQTNSVDVRLPPEEMTLRFIYGGNRYQIIFMQLTRKVTRQKPEATTYKWYGENYLLFQE